MADFWQTDKQGRTWGPFTNDPDTSLNFSFDVSDWLADRGDGLTAGALSVEPGPGLELGASLQAGPVLTVRIDRTAEPFPNGIWRPFDLQLLASDG